MRRLAPIFLLAFVGCVAAEQTYRQDYVDQRFTELTLEYIGPFTPEGQAYVEKGAEWYTPVGPLRIGGPVEVYGADESKLPDLEAPP